VELKHHQRLSDLQTFMRTSTVTTEQNLSGRPAGSFFVVWQELALGGGADDYTRRPRAIVQQI
jgi:hypothetical protein